MGVADGMGVNVGAGVEVGMTTLVAVGCGGDVGANVGKTEVGMTNCGGVTMLPPMGVRVGNGVHDGSGVMVAVPPTPMGVALARLVSPPVLAPEGAVAHSKNPTI